MTTMRLRSWMSLSLLFFSASASPAPAETAETALDYQGVVSSMCNETFLLQVVTNWTRAARFHVEGKAIAFQMRTGERLWQVESVLGPANELYLSPDGKCVVWLRRSVSVPNGMTAPDMAVPVGRIFREGVLVKEVTFADLRFSVGSVGEHSRQIFLHDFGWSSPLLRDDERTSMSSLRQQMMSSKGRMAEPAFFGDKVRFTLLDRKNREIDLKTGTVSIYP
jgi:hypothetical protein